MTFATLPMALVVVFGQYAPLTHEMTLSDGLESPTRLTVTTSQIMVTDLLQNAVVRFDLAGTPLGSWSEPAGPIGIAAHPDGRIFVSRRDDAQVAVYDASFAFLRFLGAGVVTFTAPTDMDVDPFTGRIYVMDSGADRFVVFDDSEALVMMVGMRGAGASQFKYPAAIAVDVTTGHIAVADQDNYRVQLFSDSGLYERSFGYRIKYLPGGGSEGWLQRTSGVAFDASGQVYVLDTLMGSLRVFSPTGTELAQVAQYGFASGELRSPTDVAVDLTGRVYVANAVAGTVEVYSPFVPTIAAAAAAPARGTNDSAHDALLRRQLPATEHKQLTARTSRSDGHGTIATTGGWEPPHLLADTTCGRCHDVDGQPEGHIGLVDGQANVCVSCHIGGGQGQGALMLPSANVGMSHKWGVDAINETFGSTGPLPSGPMADHLDAGLIKCATCHNQHNNTDGVPFLRAAGDAICRECHSEHIGHTPEGPWQPGCRDCHQAHDPTARNFSLISGSILNQTLGVDKAVVFIATTGANSFDDGDPAANDGVCQVCHTATTYHTHDGTGASHNDGQDCTSCHPHENGFMPSGGGSCTGCHAGPQDNGDGAPIGGRRAVVGEFPLSDAHAHYGVELDDTACQVCHSLGTHQDGFVELIDQDDGSIYRFSKWQDLTASPDVSDFCASCHDGDGASLSAAPFDPFGNGSPAPDVAMKFAGTLQWEEEYGDFCFGTEGTFRPGNSHHDISDADQTFSGAKIECLNCHGAHAAGGTQPLADPFNATTAWTGTDNEFCLACHNGGSGPLDPGFPVDVWGPVIDTADPRWAGFVDWTTRLGGACLTSDCSSLRGIESCDYVPGPWYVDYNWTHSAHGPDSKRGWNGYSGADGADMACMDCHDPHGSYTPTNTAGNPYMIRDSVDGTAYVDDGTRPAGFNGPPFETFGVAREVVIPVSGVNVGWGDAAGLCSACHAGWLAAYDWHSYCTSCQTCHAHGGAWGEYDWENYDDDTPCPLPTPMPAIEGGTAGDGAMDAWPRLHLWEAGTTDRLDVGMPPNGRPEEAVQRPVTKQK